MKWKKKKRKSRNRTAIMRREVKQLGRVKKEFELLFKLKASLGGNFNSTFKSAINTNNQLRDSLKNVNSLQSKIDGYTKQSAAIDKNK